jgi:hypothetical protein
MFTLELTIESQGTRPSFFDFRQDALQKYILDKEK